MNFGLPNFFSFQHTAVRTCSAGPQSLHCLLPEGEGSHVLPLTKIFLGSLPCILRAFQIYLCKAPWGLLTVSWGNVNGGRDDDAQMCASGRWGALLRGESWVCYLDRSLPVLPFSLSVAHYSSLNTSVAVTRGWVKACVRAPHLERWIRLLRRQPV